MQMSTRQASAAVRRVLVVSLFMVQACKRASICFPLQALAATQLPLTADRFQVSLLKVELLETELLSADSGIPLIISSP